MARTRTYDGFDRLLTETTAQGTVTYRMTRWSVGGPCRPEARRRQVCFGGIYVDVTAINGTERIRVQTIDILADGITLPPEKRQPLREYRKNVQDTL